MNQPELNDKEQADLDPAMARVQAKLKRLLAGSTLVMGLGLVAVIAVIFYKINNSDQSSAKISIPDTINVGQAADILDVNLHNGQLILLVRAEDGLKLLHFDASSGKELGETRLISGVSKSYKQGN